MKFTLIPRFLLALCFTGSAFGQPAEKAKKAPKEPDPSLAQVTDTPGLPRVLLIGDSISIGYTLPVRARLQGKANLHRPGENCSDSAKGVRSLDKWLGEGKWDVIHFNFGLHDVKYLDAAGKYVPPEKGKQVASVADYEANLRKIVARLKETKAKLIFATTTPVPSGSLGRVEHDELRYNAAAVKLMHELGVAVDDLHAVVVPQQNKIQLPHNVHYTPAGYEQLADVVAREITAALPAAKK